MSKDTEENWHYPSKGEYPPFFQTVYIWDKGNLYKGQYKKSTYNPKSKYKYWSVYNKGGIEAFQQTVEAWMYLSDIKPPNGSKE